MVLAEWGKQRGSGEYCRWGTVGSRTFPLIKKETMTLGIPNLWMSWKITRISPQEKHLSVRRNFRSVHLDQEKATTAPCKSVMSELSHLVAIYPVPTWPQEWRSREGERRNLAEMDTSALPGRSPGPQQGRGKQWVGWIWDGADTWLTWTWETQSDGMRGMAARWCRRWGCSGAWVTAAPGGGWASSPVYVLQTQPLCPPEFHMMKSWFPCLWYPNHCNYMNCSLPGSSIHGIFQARLLEWVTIAFSAKKH